jgi:type VI secretion system ImpM family protein
MTSLFGKLPCALDFVRVRHDYREAIALDDWLQSAVQALAVSELRWPATTFQFVLRPGASAAALVGVVAPSRDRAGRSYPLAIFTRLPLTAAVEGHAAGLLAAQPFVGAATELLGRAGSLSLEELTGELAALKPPCVETCSSAREELARAFTQLTLRDFAQLTLGELPSPDADGGGDVCRVLGALQRLQSGRNQPVFELLAGSPLEAALWLRLAELAARQPACCLWASQQPGQLLFAQRALEPQAVVLLHASRRPRARLCKLLEESGVGRPAVRSGEMTLAAACDALR